MKIEKTQKMKRKDQMCVILGFQEGKQIMEVVRSLLEKMWRVRCSADENMRQMEDSLSYFFLIIQFCFFYEKFFQLN